MSEVFTVKSVGPEPREWSSSHGGTFLSYSVDLEEADGTVAKGIEWTKKPESQAPAISEEVVGHLEEGNFGPKFKIDYEATKELGQGSAPRHNSTPASSGGSAKPWQPESERDPERAARILRQHSQEMALLFMRLTGQSVGSVSEVFQVADKFDQDVIQAGQAVNSAQGPSPAQAGASPSQSASPGSNSPSADEPEFFSKLLQDAHQDVAAANELGKFISAKFSIEQKQKAQRELGELEAQGDCVRRLTSAYEQSTSKLLPLSGDGADIPF